MVVNGTQEPTRRLSCYINEGIIDGNKSLNPQIHNTEKMTLVTFVYLSNYLVILKNDKDRI